MSRRTAILTFLIGILAIGGLVFGFSEVAFAQQEDLEAVGDAAGIAEGEQDIRLIIGRIINVALSFLGIIAVLIVLYGGFTWMTAGGNAEKVERAKKILINGVIGLTVIFLSWAITAFVLNALTQATGVGTGTGDGDGTGGIGGLGGSGATSFVIADVIPQGEIDIRNVVVQTTFSRNVDPETVDDASFGVYRVSDGQQIAGQLEVTGNKIEFTPDAACPNPNEDRQCFDANTEHEIRIGVDIESTAGVFLSQCATTCTYFFTTGEIVDVEDPDVAFNLPDNNENIASESLADVEVSATDDYRVGTADFFVEDTQFDSVAASGEDLSDVVISTLWDTTTPIVTEIGERYTLDVTVTDLAGNTATDNVTVEIIPAYCFNGELDDTEEPPEEGIDCGGLCGSCDGAACTDDSDCAGSCVDGFCQSLPEITEVSPLDGAPGTFVTVAGTGFQASEGAVYFDDGAGGLVAATIPECSDGWSSTEIVVEVPEGAGDGPITIETSAGLTDATNDDNGSVIEDFDVNDVERPNLCKLSPDDGGVGTSVDLIGDGFGTSEDIVTFEDAQGDQTEVRTYNSWDDANINITVPALSEQDYFVSVSVGGISSNALIFDVEEEEADAPVISSVDPEDGGPGQYITLVGNDFGTSIGLVWFENQTDGTTAIADTSFPDACGTDYWDDAQVTVKVPDVAADSYNIYLERGTDGEESNRVEFNVTSADPTPGICSISPDEGPVDTQVTVVGENFGSSEGSLTFYNEASATVTSWADEEIIGTVPSAATTGPVDITSAAGEDSNSVNFELTTDVGEEEEGPEGAEYVWRFSTGEIPIAPELVQACTEDDISAVPNEAFTDEVCVNAVVFAYFDTMMDESTINDSTILIESCDDETCAATTGVSGTIMTSTSAGQTSFTVVPDNADARWATSTTYQVTATTGAQSADGTPLDQNVNWQFTTSASSDDCTVESVRVSPGSETLTVINQTTEFNALPSDGECQVLNADDYSWTWETDSSLASLSEGCEDESGDSCVTVEALAEGETTVDAEEDASGVVGSADLTINFTDPFVDNQWPDCAVACVNAEVGASFNIAMDQTSIEAPDAVILYECDNEFCTNTDNVVSNTADCIDEGSGCTEVSINLTSNLDTLAYYRVVISGDVMSESGVALTRANYGADYSWTFLTREDDTECSISRIEIEPDDPVLSNVGETQSFTAIPHGEPDACSVAGQRLNGYEFSWNWTDPIDDTSTDDADIASWVTIGGGLFDVDQDAIPDGCTASCTAEGSEPIVAICGNGDLETGEDCDDGNTTNGDGCSDSCLSEGSDTCSMECSVSGDSCVSDDDCDVDAGESCGVVGSGCCGDGVVSGAEECDDSNTQSGDGCSASCLNEGSRAAGLTCGDGIVTHDSSSGGEECEDGNSRGGDGCSSICLNEGSEGISDVPAVCGNGTIESPYETCDDGNFTDGDGCSSSCLREGSLSSVSTGFTCGDGTVERIPSGLGVDQSGGEDCDGQDGCSDECLWEGSSLDHDTPSVCGDGVRGSGELLICEDAVAGDGDADPVQLAIIDEDAAAQVDESGQATQVVEVVYEDLAATSNLSLTCTAETDDDCPADFGVDSNGCCSERPDVSLHPNGSDVCLNAAVYLLSDKEMSTSSFSDNAYLRYDGGGACPDEHETFFETANSGQSWFARLWRNIRSFFVDIVNAQADGDCIVPISGFTQTETSDGFFKVSFVTGVLLESLSDYTIVVEGGANGATTATGVALEDDIEQSFVTGEEICTLDVIDIEDQTGETEGLFTRFDDAHDMLATPYTVAGGVQQQIQQVSGVYEWDWQDWQEDSGGSIFTVTVPDPVTPDQANVAPTGVNGEAVLIAQAEIVEDGIATEDVVSGSLDLVALLCENPWPTADLFPFEDSQEGYDRYTAEGLTGLTPDPAFMHFSTYYCRDTDDEDDLLPKSGVVSIDPTTRATAGRSEDVIKEYFFATGGTDDVIGIRVVSNPEYLSPLAWYEDREFDGSPSETTVDGFEAVEDGRTVYVAAPNEDEDATDLYSNIYVISYNEGASEDAINIYNQMLENWSFVINLEDTNLCHDGTAYTSTVCSSDLDCDTGAGEFCASDKDKIRRDTARLADMTTIQSTLNGYGNQNGLCSATTSQSCETSADCPAGETCQSSYPALQSGTFVRSISASAWSSWDDNLGALLGVLPDDPLNDYVECGEGTTNADHSAETCVNEALGEYICPEESFVYHYRSEGAFGYSITSELEYESSANSAWASDIDQDASDNLEIVVGNAATGSGNGFSTSAAFCDGSSYGDSDICGDGIVGSGEACEVGQEGPTGSSCDSDGDGIDDGFRSTICNASCTAFEVSDAAACVPYSCGNGLIEGTEICDDGSLNGSYGFCNSDCSGYDFFCGDGSIAGGEVCDCGTTGSSGLTSGGTSCTVANGVYGANPNDTCSWSCGGPASYCGDNIVQTGSGEQCDGENDTWDGQLCRFGSERGMPCETSDDCGGFQCGSGTFGFPIWADSCPETTVCLAGANQGFACVDDADCPGSQCSTFETQTTRTRTCADDGEGGDLCQWNENTWRNIDCKALGSCGDGVVDDGEECDDGNDDDTDACTNVCTVNVCGDGFLHAGVEQCDEGSDNGIVCSASYDSTCTYCSSSCRLLSSSGAFCGDGVINGGEFCDAGDLNYYWLDLTTGELNGTCEPGTSPSGTEICTNVGACNGGDENGEICDSNADCSGGGTCVFPTCNDSCTSSCPYTYGNEELQLLDNQVGATRSTSVNLLSATETEDATILGDPNAATLYIPECTVLESLTADIDESNREFPDIEIMFVLDISQSMETEMDSGETRLEVLQDAVSEAATTLFEAYDGVSGATMRIGLAYIGNEHGEDTSGDGEYQSGELYDFVDLNPTSSEGTVESHIGTLLSSTAPDVGTPIYESIKDAEIAFTGSADVEYLVVFTDGNIYNTSGDYGRLTFGLIDTNDDDGDGVVDNSEYMEGVSNLTDDMKNDDVKIFTAVVADGTCNINQMERWSSLECSSASLGCSGMSIEGNYTCDVGDDGIQYSYSATTAEELRDMYDEIVSSILDVNLTITFGGEQAVVTVSDGSANTIELPSSFSCDEFNEQGVTLRTSFIDQGEGTVSISNIRANMCSP